jgi:hypothetical protein
MVGNDKLKKSNHVLPASVTEDSTGEKTDEPQKGMSMIAPWIQEKTKVIAQRLVVRSRKNAAENIHNLGTFQRRWSQSWEAMHQKNRKTLDPDSLYISIWNIFLLGFIFIDLIVIAIFLCFANSGKNMCNNQVANSLLYVGDIFFMANMFVQMHTGYYLEGDIVRKPALTRKRFFLSWDFPLDFLALMPIYLFNITGGTDLPFFGKNLCGLVHLNKLLRVRRVPGYTKDFDKVRTSIHRYTNSSPFLL